MPKVLTKPLTQTQINAKIAEHETKPFGGRVAVGGVAGLYLKTGGLADNSKSWVLTVMVGTRTNAKGEEVPNRINLGLGPFPEVSLQKAREKAAELRVEIRDDKRNGIDYAAKREQRKAEEAAARAAESANRIAKAEAKTFEWCARQFIDGVKAKEITNKKALAQWHSTFEQHVYSVEIRGEGSGIKFGDQIVGTLTDDDVYEVMERIWDKIPETARRVRMRVANVFDWAMSEKYSNGERYFPSGINPASLTASRLKNLPSIKKSSDHMNALPYEKVGEFIADLRGRMPTLLDPHDLTTAKALEWLVLTGSRTIEVRRAKWDSVDFERRMFTLYEDETKTGIIHDVPLTDYLIELLKSLPRVKDNPYVFAGECKDEGLVGALAQHRIDKFLEKMQNEKADYYVDRSTKERCSPHGFRSTFKEWAAELTKHEEKVIDIQTSHSTSTEKDKVKAAYMRRRLMPKRLALVNDWIEFVSKPMPKNVAPLHAAAA